MKVDGARPNSTAAGQTDSGLSISGQQRTQAEDAGSHFSDDVIGRNQAFRFFSQYFEAGSFSVRVTIQMIEQ